MYANTIHEGPITKNEGGIGTTVEMPTPKTGYERGKGTTATGTNLIAVHFSNVTTLDTAVLAYNKMGRYMKGIYRRKKKKKSKTNLSENENGHKTKMRTASHKTKMRTAIKRK